MLLLARGLSGSLLLLFQTTVIYFAGGAWGQFFKLTSCTQKSLTTLLWWTVKWIVWIFSKTEENFRLYGTTYSKYVKDCKTWRWLLGTFPYWSWALTFLETKSPCLNERNGLTLPCLSHCALNTNLCWQGVMSLLFTASAGQTSTERFGTNKGDTTSTLRYSSYLIKSDNMLVTVMLTINHTRNL